MHIVDGAAGGIGRDGCEEGRIGDAEPHLLAFHIAAGLKRAWRGIDGQARESRIAAAFGGIDGERPGQKQNAHDGEDRPALALLADHPAEHIGQRRANRKDQHHLDEIGERVGVLVGMRRIGVEEAAAIGAQHFDDFLAGHRTLGDHLFAAFERRRLDIGAQILRHALPDEKQSDDDRDRQKHIENGAGHIDPEIADGSRRAAGKAPDEGDGERDAGRGGHEIMHGEPGHLGQIAHRRLGRIGLPIGVGDEAHRRIERRTSRLGEPRNAHPCKSSANPQKGHPNPGQPGAPDAHDPQSPEHPDRPEPAPRTRSEPPAAATNRPQTRRPAGGQGPRIRAQRANGTSTERHPRDNQDTQPTADAAKREASRREEPEADRDKHDIAHVPISKPTMRGKIV